MKYLLIGLFLSFNVYASNDVIDARLNISIKLNQVVKDLKSNFQLIDESLHKNLEETSSLEVEVDNLVTKSNKKESNPTILKHGNTSLKTSCDYDSENLNWTGSEWRCLPANVLSDCTAASDEYKISKSDGSYECQRSSSINGGKLNSYWKFTGYSINCDSTSGQYSNIYGCFYKNKLNQEIQIENSECSGKSKPTPTNKTCTSSWLVSSWSVCSKSCGTGSQTRSVTCPDGKVCLSTKPSTSQVCNTQVCTTSWVVGSWSACNKTCGGGKQTRSVTCPSGYVCSGTKPSSSQTCNTQACTANWAVGSWSTCSKTCGGGTQTRSVTCPSGFSCKGPKPSISQSCNTQQCSKAVTFKCSSGWSLSGSKCIKVVKECGFGGSSGRHYVIGKTGNCGWGGGYIYYWNGKTVYVGYSASKNGYSIGSVVRSNSYTCRSGQEDGTTTYYKICGNVTKSVDATISCPSGYTYSKSQNLCIK